MVYKGWGTTWMLAGDRSGDDVGAVEYREKNLRTAQGEKKRKGKYLKKIRKNYIKTYWNLCRR